VLYFRVGSLAILAAMEPRRILLRMPGIVLLAFCKPQC